jgi:hypothetical protein
MTAKRQKLNGSITTSSARPRGPLWFLIALALVILTNQTTAMKTNEQMQAVKEQTYGKQEKNKTKIIKQYN